MFYEGHPEMDSDAYKRTPKKPSMYGDWEGLDYKGSEDDTDTEGNLNGWLGNPSFSLTPDQLYQHQPRRHSKKHDWGDQLCSKPGCYKLLRETPQVRWGPEGPMCNACGCKRSRDRAKAHGGHIPHFPKGYYHPEVAYALAYHYGYSGYEPAPPMHPMPLQGPMGLLPAPPAAHYASHEVHHTNVTRAPQAVLAMAANNTVHVVKRTAARRSVPTSSAAAPADGACGPMAQTSSSSGSPLQGATEPAAPHSTTEASAAAAAAAAAAMPAMNNLSGSASPAAKGSATKPDQRLPSHLLRSAALDDELEPAAAAPATSPSRPLRRGTPAAGGSAGNLSSGMERARSSSPGDSMGSLWEALLQVTKAESQRSKGHKRCASEAALDSDQEITSPRSRPHRSAKLSRFAQEIGTQHRGSQGWSSDSEATEDEQPQQQQLPLFTATGRPARHAHKQLGEDFVAP